MFLLSLPRDGCSCETILTAGFYVESYPDCCTVLFLFLFLSSVSLVLSCVSDPLYPQGSIQLQISIRHTHTTTHSYTHTEGPIESSITCLDNNNNNTRSRFLLTLRSAGRDEDSFRFSEDFLRLSAGCCSVLLTETLLSSLPRAGRQIEGDFLLIE